MVGGGEVEGVVVAEPALEWLVGVVGVGEVLAVSGVCPDEGWGAWSAVEEFVAAADGEVCAGFVEVDGDCACGMGEVPDHECALVVGGLGDVFHVVAGAGAVVDVGEGDCGELFACLGDGVVEGFGCGGDEGGVVVFGEALADEDVCGEVFAFGDDDVAVGGGEVECLVEDFVEVDAGGVGDEDFVGVCAEVGGELVAEVLWSVSPVVFGPSGDCVGCPFVVEDGVDGCGCVSGHESEGVAAEVDAVVGGEAFAGVFEGVLVVLCGELLSGGCWVSRHVFTVVGWRWWGVGWWGFISAEVSTQTNDSIIRLT